MIRIAVFQLGYETNTFVPGRAELSDLGAGGWIPAEQVEQMFAGKRAGVSGILDGLAHAGARAVPMDLITRGGAYNAGPTMTRACVEQAMDHICAQLTARADEYDGVCAAMHGAGCADGMEDADSYFLQRLRDAVGDKPIMASLDLHGNITVRMTQLADGLFGIKENPHVDFYDAGYRAAEVLVETLRGQMQPRMALRRLPMLVPVAIGSTLDGPARQIKEYISQYARQHGLIDATFFHGFSAADTACTGASILVVADGYVPDREADELARYVWSRRADFVPPGLTAAQAVDRALELRRDGYVVVNEGTDNPGAGCPGDGTHLLAELLGRNLPGTIMGPLFDPAAAAVCHEHVVGDRFSLQVGGHSHPVFGPTLKLDEVELLALWDGKFTCVSPVHRGGQMDHGPSARLRCGNVEFIVVSNRFQTYDDQPFRKTGAQPEHYTIVALKSSNHFRAFFRDTADAIVGADTPSMFPDDVRRLDYRRLTRPIFPLDGDADYTAVWGELYR